MHRSNCIYLFHETFEKGLKRLKKIWKLKNGNECDVTSREKRAGQGRDARGILQIIPLEWCPWLVGAFVTVLARTCTWLLHETRKAGQARLGSCTWHNRAMPGRPGSIGRPGVFIGDVYIHTGHRPRITRAQFAHIKPITCFARVIREFCPDCALFNSPL